jgi:hypothetical protein
VAVEKKTERATIWMSESTKVGLMHLAAAADRSFGEYIENVLHCHVYGHLAQLQRGCEAADSGEARR